MPAISARRIGRRLADKSHVVTKKSNPQDWTGRRGLEVFLKDWSPLSNYIAQLGERRNLAKDLRKESLVLLGCRTEGGKPVKRYCFLARDAILLEEEPVSKSKRINTVAKEALEEEGVILNPLYRSLQLKSSQRLTVTYIFSREVLRRPLTIPLCFSSFMNVFDLKTTLVS